jgi:hypothetical protein
LIELENLNLKLATDLAGSSDEPEPVVTPVSKPLTNWTLGTSPHNLYLYLKNRVEGVGVTEAMDLCDVHPRDREFVAVTLTHHVNKALRLDQPEREEYMAALLDRWAERLSLGATS